MQDEGDWLEYYRLLFKTVSNANACSWITCSWISCIDFEYEIFVIGKTDKEYENLRIKVVDVKS